MTHSYKKEVNKEKKLARMAEKKAAYEASTYPDKLECRFHGFIQVNCKVCIANLKKRLKEDRFPIETPPKE